MAPWRVWLTLIPVFGLVWQLAYPQVPPKVEYRLTPWGQSLCPALDAILSGPIDGQQREERATRADTLLPLNNGQPGMYGPPLRRKRNVRMSQVGLRKCIRPLLE